MKKRLSLILLLFMLSISCMYATDEDVIDMTGGVTVSDLCIEATDPIMLTTELQTSIRFQGLINENIDLSTLQLYEIGGTEPLLDITYRLAYSNGSEANYTYKDGFVPVVDETYEFRFKHAKTKQDLVYYIKATDRPILTITEDLNIGNTQLAYVATNNVSYEESKSIFEEMYLEDEEGNNVAIGEIAIVNGMLNLSLKNDNKLDVNKKYYVRSTNKNVIITYSNFLKRNHLKVSSEPKLQTFNNDLFDYTREYNDYYIAEYVGVNINPDELDKVSFQSYNKFTGNEIIKDDVLQSAYVEVDYKVSPSGLEMLTFKIDKDYLVPGSYNIYITKNGKNYSTFQYLICDDIEKYSVYAPGKERIFYNKDFSENKNEYHHSGTDMTVEVVTFDKQSKVSLGVSELDDPRGSGRHFPLTIKTPSFENEDLKVYNVSSNILNLRQADYRKTQTFRVKMSLDSNYLKEAGLYVFYRYDVISKSWKAQETNVDYVNNLISTDSSQLGQFVVVNYKKSFYDIKEHWARNAVEDMASRGLVSGNEGIFRPNDKTTRAEFITMVVKSIKLEQTNTFLPYTDFDKKHWSHRFVMTAYSNGLISGDGEFDPNGEITRVEMATIVANAYKLNYEVNYSFKETTFTDCGELEVEEFDNVCLNKSLGIINGRSEEIFAPYAPATRAEAVAVVTNLLNILNEMK